MDIWFIIVRLLIADAILGVILGWIVLTGWAVDDGRINRRVQKQKEKDEDRSKDRSPFRRREEVQEEQVM